MTEQREKDHCGDCGVKEGEFHKPGCGMERCPFCHGQLISCDCIYDMLGMRDNHRYPTTSGLPPEIYGGGPSDEMQERFDKLLEEQGLIPFIRWPNLCSKCGELWPAMFMVPDGEWEHYIQEDKRRTMLCRGCYDHIKACIDRSQKGPYEGRK